MLWDYNSPLLLFVKDSDYSIQLPHRQEESLYRYTHQSWSTDWTKTKTRPLQVSDQLVQESGWENSELMSNAIKDFD